MRVYDALLKCGFRDRSATHINAILISSRSKSLGIREIHKYLRHVGSGKPAITFFTKEVVYG